MAKRKKASAPKSKKAAKRRHGRKLASPPTLHNINIRDNNNKAWLDWGKLVFEWIAGTTERPTTVGVLKQQMRDAGLTDEEFSVRGADDREVQVTDYPGTGPIVIPIPTDDMIDDDMRELARIAAGASGTRHYPIPRFYNIIYGGAPKVDMTLVQMNQMARRRLGEYVINECM